MNIPNTIIESIKQSEIMDLVADNAEVFIDDLLDDGVLKDIPVLGNLFKIFSASQSISNNIFTRKLLKFMWELETIPEKERIKFIEKLDEKPIFKQEIGEKLLVILDKLDDTQKAIYLARGFKLLITGSITYKEYQVLSYMIDKLNIAYLLELATSFKYRVGNIPIEIYDHFLYCGIFQSKATERENISDDHVAGSTGNLFKSKIGKLFATQIIEFTERELLEKYIEFILEIRITKSIGEEKSDVKRFRSRKEARHFLLSLDSEHFDGSIITGGQFVDKDAKSRFRRINDECYEFFYD